MLANLNEKNEQNKKMNCVKNNEMELLKLKTQYLKWK